MPFPGDIHSGTPPRAGLFRGFLPLNEEAPLAVNGQGHLNALIKNKSRSSSSLQNLHRSSSFRARALSVEEDVGPLGESDSYSQPPAEERRFSILHGPLMRSQRLIGNSNPRYRWERYWKTSEELRPLNKTLRQYYERTNSLIQQYIYIDRLLDSSLPHALLNEYVSTSNTLEVPPTISEEPGTPASISTSNSAQNLNGSNAMTKKVKRTPREIYKVSAEDTPLLHDDDDDYDGPRSVIPGMEDDSVESGDRIVKIAIYINLVANAILLAGKIVVMVLTSSLSVLASLVDAALDFLSSGIVWTTTMLIERQDMYNYPVGRRRLEPIGVLVFAVVMITSFFQVALECFSRLNSGDHTVIELTLPAIIILAATIFIKGLCWFWCRLVKNSSVQALAQDAETDVIFNIFSIIFPLVGFYLQVWWLDALGGLLLSFYVIYNWSKTSAAHIRNLAGAASTADERNVLLYLTMRFAKTIKQIQGLQAYHAGDKLNVEVDIVLDENISLRDSHDLGESLQYVLESVPTVDRAFVHQDYAGWNLPTHMQQQGE